MFSNKKYLTADIGGTNIRLAIVESQNKRYTLRALQTYHTTDCPNIATTIQEFLLQQKIRVNAIALACAGPLQNNRTSCTGTNGSWSVDTQEIKEKTGISRVILLNDFEAIGFGMSQLHESQTIPITENGWLTGTIAIIGAGTGLGMTTLIYEQGRSIPIPSEGGHADLALDPTNPLESKLAFFLKKRKIPFEAESILSGEGIVRLYEFFSRNTRKMKHIRASERAAFVTKAALVGKDPAAIKSMALFIAIYARHARILTLSTAATTLILAGGISPKIAPLLQDAFIENFAVHERTPLRTLLEQVHIFILTDEKIALYGCAEALEQ
ncbi:MAG: ROK family protein [Candidatus Woesearchaeota archaeon]